MPNRKKLVLGRWERKELLGQGAQTRIAKQLGLSDPSLVSRVVHCEKTHVRNPRIEAAIAEEIGLPVSCVFPPRAA